MARVQILRQPAQKLPSTDDFFTRPAKKKTALWKKVFLLLLGPFIVPVAWLAGLIGFLLYLIFLVCLSAIPSKP